MSDKKSTPKKVVQQNPQPPITRDDYEYDNWYQDDNEHEPARLLPDDGRGDSIPWKPL